MSPLCGILLCVKWEVVSDGVIFQKFCIDEFKFF